MKMKIITTKTYVCGVKDCGREFDNEKDCLEHMVLCEKYSPQQLFNLSLDEKGRHFRCTKCLCTYFKAEFNRPLCQNCLNEKNGVQPYKEPEPEHICNTCFVEANSGNNYALGCSVCNKIEICRIPSYKRMSICKSFECIAKVDGKYKNSKCEVWVKNVIPNVGEYNQECIDNDNRAEAVAKATVYGRRR